MPQIDSYPDSSNVDGWRTGTTDTSRSKSPAARPSKRSRVAYRDPRKAGCFDDNGEQPWPEKISHQAPGLTFLDHEGHGTSGSIATFPGSISPSAGPYGSAESFQDVFLRDGSLEKVERKRKMQTGCIPCLLKGIPCNTRNRRCRLAISDDWSLNTDPNDDKMTPTSLSLFRPDTKWRRTWRERHSLNFFVNFSAPQMAGFFDSAFWQRTVIQTSYYEPSVLHAIIGIGALHEAIMQRAFADEKRKAQAMEFALSQCNRAIACLTYSGNDSGSEILIPRATKRVPDPRVALTTCVLFTCFEAMQGRCDSAVNHALQGRRLLQATSSPNAESISLPEEHDLEQMRPLVEKLEIQATALLGKGMRTDSEAGDQPQPLPRIGRVFSLDHAHYTLHTALNNIMRFTQHFDPTASRNEIANTMSLKYLRYAPWFRKWEVAFRVYLADRQEAMSNLDRKRAMVLKANHLVATMLVSVDQSAGPKGYDAFEAEFKAIVDLSREVLASFSCPPLPTLNGGKFATAYLSFSLWVTDPLWMAISRCRNPSVRQAAFTLLSQNPRQEGIWHAGPQIAGNKYMRRVEAGPSLNIPTVRGDRPPDDVHENAKKNASADGDSDETTAWSNGTAQNDELGTANRNNPESDEAPPRIHRSETRDNKRVRGEWVDLHAQISGWDEV